jgi:UDP-N-acetylmuramoyl-tripeptide--D-alanyl-D-alanine ligase
VTDTLKALQRWGKARLAAVCPKSVLAITGSVGKTSTKNLLAAATKAWKTPGNRNNIYGIPEALATMPDDFSTAVIEMGISTPNEMECLTDIAPPNFGLITNIGISHIENFTEGQKGIAKAKGKLIQGLIPGGAWVYLADDPWCQWLASLQSNNHTKAIAVGHGSNFGWEDEVSMGVYGEQFTLFFPDGKLRIKIRLRGRHQVRNAALAGSLAIIAGYDCQQIVNELAAVEPELGRGRIHNLKDGGLLLDETYNASYDSIMACARSLAELDGGKLVAVLGCVREIGSYSEHIHWQIGKDLKAIGFQKVLVYGDNAQVLADGFGCGANAFMDYESLRDDPNGLSTLKPSERILVKGSRFWMTERVVIWLLGYLS